MNKKTRKDHAERNPWILTVDPRFSIMLYECFSRNCKVPRCFWLEISISPTPYQIRNEIPYMSAESHETSTFPTANHEIKLPTIWTTDLWLTGRNRGSFTDLVDQISRCSSRKVSQKWFETLWEHNRTKNNNNNSWCNDDKKNYKSCYTAGSSAQPRNFRIFSNSLTFRQPRWLATSPWNCKETNVLFLYLSIPARQ